MLIRLACARFRPMSRLGEIIAYKRKEIEPWLAHTADWHQRAAALGPFRGFRKTLISGGVRIYRRSQESVALRRRYRGGLRPCPNRFDL